MQRAGDIRLLWSFELVATSKKETQCTVRRATNSNQSIAVHMSVNFWYKYCTVVNPNRFY